MVSGPIAGGSRRRAGRLIERPLLEIARPSIKPLHRKGPLRNRVESWRFDAGCFRRIGAQWNHRVGGRFRQGRGAQRERRYFHEPAGGCRPGGDPTRWVVCCSLAAACISGLVRATRQNLPPEAATVELPRRVHSVRSRSLPALPQPGRRLRNARLFHACPFCTMDHCAWPVCRCAGTSRMPRENGHGVDGCGRGRAGERAAAAE